jgi:hypothetical protein
MASHIFNEFKRAVASAEINFSATDVFKTTLLMTNTTGDTDFEANTVSAIGTLDEMDGSGFTWGFGDHGRLGRWLPPHRRHDRHGLVLARGGHPQRPGRAVLQARHE